MRKFILLAAFILLAFSSFAQLFTIFGREIGFFYAGPKLGVNLSQISNWSEFGDNENKNRVGFQLGAVGEIGITQRLSLDGEVTFMSKGQKQNFPTGESNLRVGYIGIPLLAKYSFQLLGLSKVYAKGGTFTSVKTGGSWVTKYDNGDTYSDDLSSEGWTRFDWGFTFGCGAEYKMDQGIIGFDLRYDLGVIDVHKSDPTKNRNRSFGITMVYKFDMVDLLTKKRDDKHEDS